jgi:hypothetical protein
MDQHRAGSAAERLPEILSGWQTDKAQVLHQIEQLKGTTRRVYAMLSAYQELAQQTQVNIDDAWALTQDINNLAQRFGLTPVSETRIELPDRELAK